MPIGLENSLTATAAREIDHANKRASGLGESMTTGTNKFAEVVDKFLGSSLKDNEIMLGAIAKNTAYGINMLTITDEYLSTISTTLQNGISSIIKAGTVSSEKVNVLQKNLKDLQSQIKLLVRTAEFDGKKLLGGKADMAVQVGLSVADNINVKINDLSDGKMMRTTVTNALNEALAKGNVNLSAYYNNAGQPALDADYAANTNLAHKAITNAGANIGAHGGNAMTDAQVGVLLKAAIDANPSIAQSLQSMATVTAFQITKADNAKTFANASAAEIQAALTAQPGANEPGGAVAQAGRIQLTKILADFNESDADKTLNITTPQGRAVAQDVLAGAQNSIRAMQASVSNQKSNVAAAADALRSTTNVTQKAADSYLKTDYVMTAQQYSETIKRMVASITTLQAANKIPEAAQRLIDALAR